VDLLIDPLNCQWNTKLIDDIFIPSEADLIKKMTRQAKTCVVLKARAFGKVFGLSEFQTKLTILCGERVRIRFPPN